MRDDSYQARGRTSWERAVRGAVGPRRDPFRGFLWETDAEALLRGLEGLMQSGRCVAATPDGQTLKVDSLHYQRDTEPTGAAADSLQSLHEYSICFVGELEAWTARLGPVRYIKPKRGGAVERGFFHMVTGHRAPYTFAVPAQEVSSQHPRSITPLPAGQVLLLSDMSMNVLDLVRAGAVLTSPDTFEDAQSRFHSTSLLSDQDIDNRQKSIDAIRSQYMDERRDTGQAIKQEDIDVIVQGCVRHGILPTFQVIHAVTGGRGSPNQLRPKIDDAFRRLTTNVAKANDARVPSELVTLWDRLRREAVASGQQSISHVQDELARERQSLVDEKTDLIAKHQSLVATDQARQQHIASLNDQLRVERQALSAAQKQLSSASEELITLRVELRHAGDALTEASNQTNAISEKLSESDRARALLDDQLHRTRDELSSSKEAVAGSRAAQNAANAKIAQLEAQYQAVERARVEVARQVESAQSHIAHLEAGRSLVDNALHEANAQLEAATAKLNALNRDHETLQARFDSLQQEHVDQATHLDSATTQLQHAARDGHALRAMRIQLEQVDNERLEQENLRVQADGLVAELRHQITDLHEGLERLKTEAGVAPPDVQEALARLTILQQRLDDEIRKNGRLESTLETVAKERDYYSEMWREMEKAYRERAEAEAKVGVANNERDIALASLAQAQAKIAELTNALTSGSTEVAAPPASKQRKRSS